MIQQKQIRNDTNKLDNENNAMLEKFLEYESFTSKQHKQI